MIFLVLLWLLVILLCEDIVVFALAFGYFFCLFDLAILLVRRFVSFVLFYEVVVNSFCCCCSYCFA